MELLIWMLPLYILGNLHCAGMCGPLVFILGKNPKKYWYFAGRISSFTLAGLLAGELGTYLLIPFKAWHLTAVISIGFGFAFFIYGLKEIFSWKFFDFSFGPSFQGWVQKTLCRLSSKGNARAVFLYGFFTLFLPCGQSALVFASCALSGSAFVGLINGFAFALLTSPALIIILKAHKYLSKFKGCYQPLFGLSVILVGVLSILRGMADMGWIDHFAINQSWHLILY